MYVHTHVHTMGTDPCRPSGPAHPLTPAGQVGHVSPDRCALESSGCAGLFPPTRTQCPRPGWTRGHGRPRPLPALLLLDAGVEGTGAQDAEATGVRSAGRQGTVLLVWLLLEGPRLTELAKRFLKAGDCALMT